MRRITIGYGYQGYLSECVCVCVNARSIAPIDVVVRVNHAFQTVAGST